MKRFLSAFIALALSSVILSGCGSANSTSSKDEGSDKTYNIGVIQYTEHPALDAAREGFVEALKEAGYTDGDNIKLDVQNAQADQSNLKTIAQKFVTDKKDLVFAIATPAAQSMAAETKDIPILVTAVTDPAQSDLVESNQAPNTNVSGTSDMNPVSDQISLLKQLVPQAKKIAILYCSGEQNSVLQAKMAKEAADKLGLESKEETVSNTNDVAQIAESLVGKYDAVYVPTDNVLASSMPLLTSITNPKGLPVIVGEEGMVEGGGLASVAIDYSELGKLTGNMAVEIFNGKDIKTMPIQYTENPQLVVNKKVASEMGITIPDDVASKAKMIGE